MNSDTWYSKITLSENCSFVRLEMGPLMSTSSHQHTTQGLYSSNEAALITSPPERQRRWGPVCVCLSVFVCLGVFVCVCLCVFVCVCGLGMMLDFNEAHSPYQTQSLETL